jgi:hypothetical protein
MGMKSGEKDRSPTDPYFFVCSGAARASDGWMGIELSKALATIQNSK